MGGRAAAAGRDQNSRNRHDHRRLPDPDRRHRPRHEGLAIHLNGRRLLNAAAGAKAPPSVFAPFSPKEFGAGFFAFAFFSTETLPDSRPAIAILRSTEPNTARNTRHTLQRAGEKRINQTMPRPASSRPNRVSPCTGNKRP